MFCLTPWKLACLAQDGLPVCSHLLLLNTLKAESTSFTSASLGADRKMVCSKVFFKRMGVHDLMLPTHGLFILGYSGMSQVIFLVMEPEWQKKKRK